MNWLRMSLYLWPAMIIAWLTLSGVLLLVILGCFIADVARKLIERRAMHVDGMAEIDRRHFLQWGTIYSAQRRQHVKFFRLKLPLSMRLFPAPNGESSWYERWLVWTETRGWFTWYEPAPRI